MFKKIFPPKSPDEFAEKVLAYIKAHKAGVEMHYNQDQFCIELGGEMRQKLYLANAYHEAKETEFWHWDEIIARFVRPIFKAHGHQENMEHFDRIRSLLYPQLRDRSYLNVVLGLHQDLSSMTFYDGLLPDYFIVDLVYADDDMIVSVNKEYLTKWDQTKSALLELAVSNLKAKSTPAGLQLRQDGYYVSTWSDDQDASRLLLTELFDHLKVRGRVVAFPFARNLLMVTGELDIEHLRHIMTFMPQQKEHYRVLTQLPLILSDEKQWEMWELPPGHVLYELWRPVKVQEWAQACNEQKAILEKQFIDNGIDIFVASTMVRKHDLSGYSHVSVWSRGVDTLLPKTDYIAFNPTEHEAKEIIIVAWDKAYPFVEDLMQSTDYYPPRFLVAGYPDNETLEKLRQAQDA